MTIKSIRQDLIVQLQLFFGMYNKNNPTASTEYLRGVGGGPNTFGIVQNFQRQLHL